MTLHLTLSGNAKSTQHIYGLSCRGGFAKRYMTADGKTLKEQYFWEIKKQYRGPVVEGPVTVTLRFFFNDRCKRDLDNHNKLVLDSLNGIVIADDSNIVEKHEYMGYDKSNPRVEITVEKAVVH